MCLYRFDHPLYFPHGFRKKSSVAHVTAGKICTITQVLRLLSKVSHKCCGGYCWGYLCTPDKILQYFNYLRESYGGPRRIRTPDPLIRSQVLYPAELSVRKGAFKGLRWGLQVRKATLFKVFGFFRPLIEAV